MLFALTRPVSPSLANCELTHLPRQPIDIPRAHAQHAAYEKLLQSCGAKILRAPAAPDLPDSVFVEDTAIALGKSALITRPGAASRQPETAAIAQTLAPHLDLTHMQPPATLDGGDVLRIGQTLYVGQSARSNSAGIQQLRDFARPLGFSVIPVPVTGCLHLKSAATAIADDLLVINPKWVSPAVFTGLDILEIDPAEPFAANALLIAGRVIFPDHFPRTRKILETRGINVLPVPADELAKAEGAVTCCSILFES